MENNNEVLRYSEIKGLKATESDMAAINRQSIKTLTAEDVYTFKVAASNNQVDRDYEKFSDSALEDMAKLYVGKTFLFDHDWRASKQNARIYAADVEPMPDVAGGKQLVLRVYMLKNEATQPQIDAIEGGIMREVSVGARCDSAICGICGADKRKVYCEHRRGGVYDGTTCVVSLEKASDVYECSFVAVPSNKDAGVTKTYGGEDNKPDQTPAEEQSSESEKALELQIRETEAEINLRKIESED